MEKIKFGRIELGNKVVVSDPCYQLDTWCQGIVENVKPGIYNCSVFVKDEGVFGKRVNTLRVTLDGTRIKEENFQLFEDAEICVDSGQVGVYDYDYFEKNQPDDDYENKYSWYRMICDITTESKAGTLGDKCFVSQSGFGDGSYDLYVAKNKNGEVIGFEISF